MAQLALDRVSEQLDLAEALRLGRRTMFEPQDLPGRFGRVVKGVDHVLAVMDCEGLVGGGWAVWRHGYIGRVTQDLDIVVAKDRLEEFLRIAQVSGFEALITPEGFWPKLRHKETGIQVDILPEGGRPGTAARPAPTTIPHPARMLAAKGALHYVPLPHLIELKLGAGRARDISDIVELIRTNSDVVDDVRAHLVTVHVDYVAAFDRLRQQAADEDAGLSEPRP